MHFSKVPSIKPEKIESGSSEESSSTQVSQKGTDSEVKADEKPLKSQADPNAACDEKEASSGKKKKVKKRTAPPIVFNCLCKSSAVLPFCRYSIRCYQRSSRGPRMETKL